MELLASSKVMVWILGPEQSMFAIGKQGKSNRFPAETGFSLRGTCQKSRTIPKNLTALAAAN
jgi:hypothetical protein